MNDVVVKLKEQWDIVTEIRKVVQLSKRGQNYVGLCPFHSEKTPSFYVSPAKKIFHCFGCGENGDVISFLMKHEHLSFKEVVAEKATELNISHNFSQGEKGQSGLDKLRGFLTALQAQYCQWLLTNKEAAVYLKERNLAESEVNSFGLGFAPKASVQMKWLTDNKWLDISKESGLFKDDGYPLLQERLIFPIHNSRGIIVGFSGRIIADVQLAKYINSPESSVFSKKKVLYATHLAKSAIKKSQSVIIVEGYMDVIAMHKNGLQNVVGVMGTALTEGHAKELARYTENITLLFDSDKAGQDAIIKSLDALLSNRLNIKIAQISEKDPAEFFEKNNSETMHDLVTNAPVYMDFFMNQYLNRGCNDPTLKSKAVNFLGECLAKERNKIIKDEYIKHIAERFSVSLNIVQSYALPKEVRQMNQKVEIKTDSKFKKAEEVIAFLLITDKLFRDNNIDDLRELVPFLKDKEIFELFKNSSLVDYEIINQINHSEIKSFLVSLIIKFTELNISFTQTEMEEYKRILNQKKIEHRINEIRSLLGNAQGNQERELLIELSGLIKKIK